MALGFRMVVVGVEYIHIAAPVLFCFVLGPCGGGCI